MSLSVVQGQTLIGMARDSIVHGLDHDNAPQVDPADYDVRLQRIQSSFVTLRISGRLRGCMGGLEPCQPLIKDVAVHAYMAAFSDSRFTPVTKEEYRELDIHLSLLSARASISFSSEANLLEQLRPGVDGLIISLGDKKATFLPSVWDSLPEPRVFLEHLKEKAGMEREAADYQAWRYTADSVG